MVQYDLKSCVWIMSYYPQNNVGIKNIRRGYLLQMRFRATLFKCKAIFFLLSLWNTSVTCNIHIHRNWKIFPLIVKYWFWNSIYCTLHILFWRILFINIIPLMVCLLDVIACCCFQKLQFFFQIFILWKLILPVCL